MEPSVILFTGPFLFFFTSFLYTHIFNSFYILKINHVLYRCWQFSPLHFQHNIQRKKLSVLISNTEEFKSLNKLQPFYRLRFCKSTMNYFHTKLSILFKIAGIYIFLKYYHLALKFFSVLDLLSCISFSYLTVEMHTWALQEA